MIKIKVGYEKKGIDSSLAVSKLLPMNGRTDRQTELNLVNLLITVIKIMNSKTI